MVYDPQVDLKVGHKGQKLRNHRSHALSIGLKVSEYNEENPKIEKEMQEVASIWLKARKGPQIFLGDLTFFERRFGRRWFYLKDAEDRIIAVAQLCRLEKYEGWLLKFFITIPSLPRGASEFFMLEILEILKFEGCRHLIYGMVPTSTLDEIKGVGKYTSLFIQTVFKMAKWFFKLNQRRIYWEKFQPTLKKSYLLFSDPNIGLKQVRAIIQALNTC